MVTNTTSGFVGALRTGVVYRIKVMMKDPFGELCRGDSQMDATTLSLAVVKAFSNEEEPLVSAITTVKDSPAIVKKVSVIAGTFTFDVRFTAPTTGLAGIRIRVTADSDAPALRVCAPG